ncbi:MAG: hypothetical protein K0S47_460 [Herbinix sp.]|jgi:uncharacterized membrane protein YfcA|nr:hypothetical protein [Herbinix sp.]
MKEERRNKNYALIIVNCIAIALFIICEVISSTIYKDTELLKLLFRVLSRGLLGINFIYSSYYILFSKKSSLLDSRNQKARWVSGLLIGLVGIGMIITAILGYGVNGDPRLIWWK